MAYKPPIVNYGGLKKEMLATDKIPIANLASGTPDGTKFLLDNGVWTAPNFASKALDNLASVNINTTLLAQTGVDLGSTTKPFRDLYVFGGGTYGTNYFKFTGTPTSTRTITIPDMSGTIVCKENAQTFTGVKTWNDQTIKLRNPADTFSYTLVHSAIGSNYSLTVPLITANDTLAVLGLAQAFTALSAFSSVNIGTSSTTSIVYRLTNGGADVATQFTTSINLPSVAGSLGIFLDIANQLSFVAANGTRYIQRAFIQIGNLTNTAASESGDLIFGTQSGGTSASEKWRISALGYLTNNGAPSSDAGWIIVKAGTSTVPSIQLKSGTILSSPIAGSIEYDGVNFYNTIDTTSGQGTSVIEQHFKMTSAGGAISTIANYFTGSTNANISLVANAYYEIEIVMFFAKTTTEAVTWSLINSAAPTSQNIQIQASPAGGISGTFVATYLESTIYNDTTATKTITTPALTTAVNHYYRFRIWLRNGTGTSLKIQAACATGSLTPGIGSKWTCKRISPNNIGTFAA